MTFADTAASSSAFAVASSSFTCMLAMARSRLACVAASAFRSFTFPFVCVLISWSPILLCSSWTALASPWWPSPKRSVATLSKLLCTFSSSSCVRSGALSSSQACSIPPAPAVLPGSAAAA